MTTDTLEFGIRHLGGPLDVQQIFELYEGRRVTYEVAQHVLEGQIATRGWSCRVACVGDKVIGFISYLCRKHAFDIQSIGVHPDYRRRGVATALLETVLRKLDDRRSGITCGVPDDLVEMHLFLRSAGFVAYTIIRREDEDDLYMFSYLDAAKEVAA